MTGRWSLAEEPQATLKRFRRCVRQCLGLNMHQKLLLLVAYFDERTTFLKTNCTSARRSFLTPAPNLSRLGAGHAV